jgi:hypothetical protein
MLVGIFALLVGLIAAVVGVTLAWPGGPLEPIWRIRSDDVHAQMLAVGWPAWAGLWAIGAIALAAGIGGLQRRRWAWAIAVGGIAVNGVGDVVQLFLGRIVEGTVGVVIAGLILLLLTRPGVSAQFDR